MKRRYLSLLLALAMVFTCIPGGIFAEDVEADVPVVAEEVVTEEAAPAEEAASEEAPEEVVSEEPAPEEEEASVEEAPEEAGEEASEEPAPEEEAAAEEEAEEVAEEVAEEEAAEEVAEEAAQESATKKLAAGTVLYAEKELETEVGVLSEDALVILTATEEDASSIRYAFVEDESKVILTAWVKTEDLKDAEGADLTEDQLKAVAFVVVEEATEEAETAEEAAEEAAAEEVAPAEEAVAEEPAPADEPEEEPVEVPVYEIEGETLKSYNGDAAEVIIPEGIKTIAKKAFQGKTSLQKVTLPDSVETIGSFAFDGCINLEKVEIGAGSQLSRIDWSAFKGASKLDRSFADGIAMVAGNAFEETAAAIVEDEVTDNVDGDVYYATSTKITINSQPVDCGANVDEPATFTVSATGVKTYAWQYRASSTSSWKAMYSSAEGANTATLSTTATETRYKYEYRCKLTDSAGDVLYTQIVKIVVPFEIVDEPEDCGANVYDPVTFTVNATGVKTYTWQYRTGATTSWKAMYSSAEGADTATLTTSATETRYKYEYRCKLTNEAGDVLYTRAVKIVIPFVIVNEPEDCEAAIDAPVTFTVEAEGVATYAWQYRTGSTTSWKAVYSSAEGADTATLTTAATATRYKYEFRCKLTNAAGDVLYTKAVKILEPAVVFEIVDEPEDCGANVYDPVTFTVNATGVKTYTWQYRASSTSSWKAMYSSAEGADTATLSTTATETRYKYEYRCKLTNEAGDVLYTRAAKIFVPFVIVDEPEDCEAAIDAPVTFTVNATGVATYAWQYRTGATTSWKAVYSSAEGADTATLTTAASATRYKYEYRCKLTNADGDVLYTKAVKILEPVVVFEIVDEPENCEAAIDAPVTFTVNATGVATYAWQYRTSATASWKAVYSSAEGKDTATLSTTATAARYKYEFRCKLTDAEGNILHTQAVKMIEPFAIVNEPEDCEAAVDAPASFTVTASAVKTYAWQYRTSATASWKAMYSSAEGADTATLTTTATAARYKYQYRCKLTSADGDVLYTQAVKILEPAIVFEIVDEPEDCEASINDPVTFTVNATGVATYTWQYRTGATTSWKAMYSSAEGKDTATLTTTATEARYNYEYRCKLTDAEGNVLYTRAAKIIRAGIELDGVIYDFIEGTNTLYVKRYNGTASSVTIPTTVEGYAVKQIGEGAFEGNTALVSISLPNAITVIGKRAFAGCTSLSSMNGHD